jgi:filamentous hemagglutinin family protein
MTSAYCRLCVTLLLCVSSWSVATPGGSQIVPDSSVNSVISLQGNTLQIGGGTTAGTNLFHSFQDFSVPTGTEAFFNNPLSIENIITRVTGSKISNIDGIIRANGTANLFLINPNGLSFGPNASLNIGGSFLGTTANTIQFADGREFNATNLTSPPLLTVSVPMGLQMGSNPGTIVVQGTGHTAQSTFAGIDNLNPDSYNLKVKPGQTLALIGGNLSLEGGLLSASGGRIELGSVTNGSAIVNFHPQGFSLSYPATNRFGNIQMNQKALADVSGISAGSVKIQGQQVNIESGSLVLVQNQGNQPAGDITVNATESLHISGSSPDFRNSSSVINETVTTGAAGNITLTAPRMTIENGGAVITGTFKNAPGGNIIVNAANKLNVQGKAKTPLFSRSSQILSTTFANGAGGHVSVTTQDLSITNSGTVGTRTYGTGNGGNLTVQADTIRVVSPTPPPGGVIGPVTSPSLLTVSTFGVGNSGNLAINTRTLSVQNGGIVSASTLNQGNAGTLKIDASESIEVKDRVSEKDTSYISAAALAFAGREPGGNAGQVTINTPVLKISNDATVFVQNQGAGDAGILRINVDKLQLETGGNISASTKRGEGGNINLQIADLLQMRHGSFINAEAGGIGNGGNISLNAPVVVGLENSDIIANAFQGVGGNIQISTQGIYGLEFRPQLTLESDITASSQFGVSGNVRITNPDIQPNAALVELPANLIDPNQKVAQGCDVAQNNRFIAIGRGGLPTNPTQRLDAEERPWTDVRDLSTFRQVETQAVSSSTEPRLVEANSWKLNQQGQVEIYVSQAGTTNFFEPTCSESQLTHLSTQFSQ